MAEFQKFKKNALNEMILQKILDSEISKDGIEVSHAEVDQEIKLRISQLGITEGKLILELQKEGISLKEYKDSIKKELERQRFIQKKIAPQINISDYDLQKEYENNIQDYQVYTKLRFIEAFLTQDKFSSSEELVNMAKAIQLKLKRRQSVSSQIKKYSSGAFAERGGDSGMIDSSQLRPEIQGILSQLKVGETSQPIPIQNGVFVFKLLAKSNPKPIPFNKVINQIRGRYGEKVVIDELKQYLMAIKDQTYVEIMP